jgi:hypothetical protein
MRQWVMWSQPGYLHVAGCEDMSRHATLRVDQVTTQHMRHARSQFAFFKARRSLALLSDVLATVDCHLHLVAKLNISRFRLDQSILLSFDCKLGLTITSAGCNSSTAVSPCTPWLPRPRLTRRCCAR